MRTLLLVSGLTACHFAPGASPVDGNETAPDIGNADSELGDTADGHPSSDAAIDAAIDAPNLVTLRQTQSDAKGGQSDACNGPGVGQSRDETYARTFPLATAFHVTAIAFLADNVNPADGITVKIGTYAGAVGTTTLSPALLTWTTIQTVDLLGSASSHMITVPISATFAAGDVLAIAIMSPGYSGAQFNVGSAAGSETLPSYFAASGCGITAPARTDPRNGSDVGTFIIDAIGYLP